MEEDLNGLLDQALEEGLRAVYQPIVDLEREETVAYEALGRGPVGSPLESPLALLDAARKTDRLVEIDWALRVKAMQGALEARLDASVHLFINVEPGTMTAVPPDEWLDLARRATSELTIVAELTERNLTRSPTSLFEMVDLYREVGIGIAIDDVGDNHRALSILPLVQPDVIKFRLENLMGDERAGVLFSSICAYAERESAELVVEQIETPEQASRVRSVGVTLGQGFGLGMPGPLPDRVERPARELMIGHRSKAAQIDSPIAISRRSARVRSMRTLRFPEIVAEVFSLAARFGEDSALIVSSPGALEGVDLIERARAIMPSLALVFAVAPGAEREVDGPWHLQPTPAGHPLEEEWVLAVSTPYASMSICAKRESADEIAFTLSHRPDLVTEVSRAVISAS